jgi:hypothetical protein
MKCFIVTKNAPFKVEVTLEGENLRLRFPDDKILADPDATPTPEQDVELVPRERIIHLGSLRERGDFGDHAIFTIYDRLSTNADKANPAVFDSVSNLYAATLAARMDTGTYHRTVMQMFPVAAVYVPLASDPVSAWSIALNVGSADDVTLGGGLEKADGITIPMTGELLVFPRVEFISSDLTVPPGGDVSFSFRLVDAQGIPITDRDAEVYLDSTAGYLVQRRVKTVGGAGTATFRADGLSVGERLKIKCGFKLFAGTDDLFVTVA